MTNDVQRVVVVGGGSAGWITAGLIASTLRTRLQATGANCPTVTLIESPEVKTIGVGEGSWPTLRHTLKKIGIAESTFIKHCDASFKQGTEFIGWTNSEDRYYHPFTVPFCYPDSNNSKALWAATASTQPFAHFASPQGSICDENKAPKTATEPDYAGFLNYGYHFNADKLGQLLKQHCIDVLNVEYVSDHVVEVESADNDDIVALHLKQFGRLTGDLFIDCTGLKGLLIDGHYQIPWQSQKHVLFNDRALAVQVPYKKEDSPIPSCTKSTAQEAGWIWDIGLQNRRGTGLVYASDYLSMDDAKTTLIKYLRSTNTAEQLEDLSFKEIKFDPGYREKFWHRNCVSVGLSSGFIEPLEASAIVMVELSAQFIAENLPSSKVRLNVLAKRFNQLFSYRWKQIINFLKYHYVLSERQSDYWLAHQQPNTIPEELHDMMMLWNEHEPVHNDFWHQDEIFSAASYQYVLFGMKSINMNDNSEGSNTFERSTKLEQTNNLQQHRNMQNQTSQLLNHLPCNKSLLKLLCKHAPD